MLAHAGPALVHMTSLSLIISKQPSQIFDQLNIKQCI